MPCVLQGRWDDWQQGGSDISPHLRISFPWWFSKALVTWWLVPQGVCSADKQSQMKVTAKTRRSKGRRGWRGLFTSWFYRGVLRSEEDSEIVPHDMSCMAKDRNQSVETQAARGSEANRARGALARAGCVFGREGSTLLWLTQAEAGRQSYSLCVNLWEDQSIVTLFVHGQQSWPSSAVNSHLQTTALWD